MYVSMEQIGQEGPMVHIGAAIASSLTWMHGRFPTHRRDGSQRYSSPYLQNISKFTQRAWPFVSSAPSSVDGLPAPQTYIK